MSTTIVTCPQCLSDGQESIIEAKAIPSSIPEYSGGFYDDIGGWHVHNPNNTQVGLQCSRGHQFTYVITNQCWCGWTNKT